MSVAVKTLVALLFAYGTVTIAVYEYVAYQEQQCNSLKAQGKVAECDLQYLRILKALRLA